MIFEQRSSVFFFYEQTQRYERMEKTRFHEEQRPTEVCGRIASRRVATNCVALMAPIIRHYAVSRMALN